jgi:hypothetical protein
MAALKARGETYRGWLKTRMQELIAQHQQAEKQLQEKILTVAAEVGK